MRMNSDSVPWGNLNRAPPSLRVNMNYLNDLMFTT